MILIGTDLSPFTRRCAVWCLLQGRTLERWRLRTADADDLATIQRHNPMGRVPVLVLPDGRALTEAFAICDHLDESWPERRLIPTGPAHLDCLQRLATAHATAEKLVAFYRERHRRPERLRNPAAEAALALQVDAGLKAMEPLADRWLDGSPPDGGEVASVCAVDMARVVMADAMAHRRSLVDLSERAQEIEAFRLTAIVRSHSERD